jgi:hypothetical protein
MDGRSIRANVHARSFISEMPTTRGRKKEVLSDKRSLQFTQTGTFDDYDRPQERCVGRTLDPLRNIHMRYFDYRTNTRDGR